MSLIKNLENTSFALSPSGNGIAITNGQRSPRDWAILATTKIMEVADTAPQPIRDQALAFQGQVLATIENYIRMALKEQRAYDNMGCKG